jgi:hypothetical protein
MFQPLTQPSSRQWQQKQFWGSVYRLYHRSPSRIITHHKSLQCTSFHIIQQLFSNQYFILIHILLLKQRILTKTTWFLTVEWWQHIIIAFVFLFSSSEDGHKWLTHVREFVGPSKKIISLINAQKVEHFKQLFLFYLFIIFNTLLYFSGEYFWT